MIVSALFALWVGSKIDTKDVKKLNGISTIINALLYVPRILFSGAVLFYAIDIIDRINGNLFTLPRETKVYEKASEYGASDFIIYREIVLHSGYLLAAVLGAAILLFVSNWKIIFILSIIGSFLTYAIQKED
jgi:hypothetical protein